MLLPSTLAGESSLLTVAALFDFQYGKSDATNRVHLLDDDSLRQVVSSKISAFLSEHEVTLPIVVGISDVALLRDVFREHGRSADLRADLRPTPPARLQPRRHRGRAAVLPDERAPTDVFPIREIGVIKCVLPVWDVPEVMLDAWRLMQNVV